MSAHDKVAGGDGSKGLGFCGIRESFEDADEANCVSRSAVGDLSEVRGKDDAQDEAELSDETGVVGRKSWDTCAVSLVVA